MHRFGHYFSRRRCRTGSGMLYISRRCSCASVSSITCPDSFRQSMQKQIERNSMVALARRVCVRPKLEEECPSWARALLPFSEQEHGLGIPCDRIPQATLEALEYFFP